MNGGKSANTGKTGHHPVRAHLEHLCGKSSRTEYGEEPSHCQGRIRAKEWCAEGPYRGRGPRGYRRTDARIWEDVAERLTEHGCIDASDMEVSVENGLVTLSGTVQSRDEKRAAEDTAFTVAGVRDVNNRLTVAPRFPRGGAAHGGRPVRTGMHVYDSEDDYVGWVIEVRQQDFLVERPHLTDVYIPQEVITEIGDDRITLSVTCEEVETEDWPQAMLIPE